MDAPLGYLRAKLKSKINREQVTSSLEYAWPALKLGLAVFEKTLDGVPIPAVASRRAQWVAYLFLHRQRR